MLVILATSMVGFNSGLLQIIQQIYLSLLGLDVASIALIISITQISSALRTVLYGMLADRYGRKRVLILVYVMGAAHFLVYFLSTDFVWFVVAALVAGGPGTFGYGYVIERALLADKSTDTMRTTAFSIRSFTTSILSTAGNSLSGLSETLQRLYGLDLVSATRLLFVLGVAISLIAVFIIALLSEEEKEKVVASKRPYLPQKSRGLILRFATTSLIMGVGGGIFFSLAPLWFYLTFNMKISDVGLLIGASKLVETSTYLLAPLIASKVGLVKAYLLTRVGGTMTMFLLPLMPNPLSAAILFSVRSSILHLSLPMKSSYMMAVLSPEERASASSLVNLPASISRASSTTLGGYLMENVSLSLPVYIGATLFLVEAAFYYASFRKIKPPEEQLERKSA
jgi:MFS family permease